MNSSDIYNELNRPFLSPPSITFPIVWTILYILMGISAYIIEESDSELKDGALKVYAVQLIFNFVWPLIFFNGNMYLFSFIWIIVLCILVMWMIFLFYQINSYAAYIQIPYILWLTFASYLNIGVYLLN